MIIADNETAIDYLYYESVAKTVVKLIAERQGEPLTVGLHGDWGAGKSSTLLMIENAYEGDDRTLCVRFNGWLFEGYDDAKAVLIETIVEALLKKRSMGEKLKAKAAEVLQNVNWFKVARTLGGAAMTFATGVPNGDIIGGLGKIAQKVIADPKSALTGEVLNQVIDGTLEHFKSEPGQNAPQRIHAFRKDFEELLAIANIDRLVVLIDDLDRCLPATAIATLEAVRLFLFVPNAAFVVAADEGMIEYAVRNHFPDLPASASGGSYARNYLEKLIQVPFRMPPLGTVETRIYLTLLLAASAEMPEEDLGKIIPIARAALQRPWLETGFDRAALEKAVKPLPAALNGALLLASEITPMLAEGARGNPRQIKRFVNTLALRLSIAVERGFRDDLKEPVLAKLMLAERFAPEVFDAIGHDLDGDGKSAIVAELEAMAGGKKGHKAGEAAESAIRDWPNIEWAKRWAGINVPLSTDLRPYYFISRDRRAILPSAITAGPVEDLIERLSSGTLAAKAVPLSELQALGATDAEKVFHALAGKVETADELLKRPIAAEGLAAICSARPELRDALIAFLGKLPGGTIGGWVVTGWGASVEGTHASAFRGLIEKWAGQSGNKPLSAVAAMALKPGAKKR